MTTAAMSSRRRSALETASCLHRYKAIYVDRVPDSNDFSLRGIGYHACKARYVERLMAQRLQADAEEAAAAFIEGIATAQTPAHLVGEVRELFDAEAERFEFDPDAYVLSEERLTGSLDEDEFTPDLVYARGSVLEVIDDKTFFRILSEREAQRNLQSRFYVRKAMQRWPGFETYRFTFRFVRYGKEVSVVFSADELAGLDRDVEAINATIDHAHTTNSWPATPGDWCGLCSLRCPIADDPRVRRVRLLTRAEAEEAAARYLALIAAVSHERAALESYCTLYGPVETGGAVFGFKPTVSLKFLAAALVDLLRQHDVEPVFSVGKSAVGSYLKAKKWAHLKPAVEALAIEKAGSRFTIARASAAETGAEEEDAECTN